MIPRDHISEKGVISVVSNKSGDAYSVVPPPLLVVETFRALKLIHIFVWFYIFLEHPKSHTTYWPGD